MENETCKKCKDGIMKLRNGKHGQFLACNAYPDCNNTENVEAKPKTYTNGDRENKIIRQCALKAAVQYYSGAHETIYDSNDVLAIAEKFGDWVNR